MTAIAGAPMIVDLCEDIAPRVDGEQTTESGIFLPEPDADKGFPTAELLTDVEGLRINVAAPTPDDVERIAVMIAAWQQRRDAEADDSPVLAFVDPMYGQRCYLLPEGARRVVGVCRAYMLKVDVSATDRGRGGQRLVVPR